MSLGAHLRKLGQQQQQQPPGGLLAMLRASGDRRLQTGRAPGTGPLPHETAAGAVTNPAEMGVGLLQSLLGDMGTAPALLIPFIAQPLREYAGIDILAPMRVSPEGSSAQARKVMQINEQLSMYQMQQNAELATNIVDAALKGVETLNERLFSRMGISIPTEELSEWMRNRDPATLGQIYGQLAATVPEVGAALSALDPSYIADFTPMVRQNMLDNNGEFNPQQFHSDMAQFRQLYDQQLFGGLPAQWALEAVGFTRTHLGRGANTAHARNVALAAESLKEAGLADTYGGAMVLAQQMGGQELFTNPARVQRNAAYLARMADRGLVDPQQLGKAANMAAQYGMHPSTAMAFVAQAGMSQAELGTATAEQFAEPSMESYRALQDSTGAQALAQATQWDRGYRRQFERALERGDVRRLDQLARRAERDPRRQQWGEGDASRLFGEISSADPQLLSGVMSMAVERGMQRMPAHLSRQMSRVLRDPAQVRRLAEGDFSQVDPRLGRMLQQSPHLLASAATLAPGTYTHGTRGVRAQRRIRPPAMRPSEVAGPVPTISDTLGFGRGRRPDTKDPAAVRRDVAGGS